MRSACRANATVMAQDGAGWPQPSRGHGAKCEEEAQQNSVPPKRVPGATRRCWSEYRLPSGSHFAATLRLSQRPRWKDNALHQPPLAAADADAAAAAASPGAAVPQQGKQQPLSHGGKHLCPPADQPSRRHSPRDEQGKLAKGPRRPAAKVQPRRAVPRTQTPARRAANTGSRNAAADTIGRDQPLKRQAAEARTRQTAEKSRRSNKPQRCSRTGAPKRAAAKVQPPKRGSRDAQPKRRSAAIEQTPADKQPRHAASAATPREEQLRHAAAVRPNIRGALPPRCAPVVPDQQAQTWHQPCDRPCGSDTLCAVANHFFIQGVQAAAASALAVPPTVQLLKQPLVESMVQAASALPIASVSAVALQKMLPRWRHDDGITRRISNYIGTWCHAADHPEHAQSTPEAAPAAPEAAQAAALMDINDGSTADVGRCTCCAAASAADIAGSKTDGASNKADCAAGGAADGADCAADTASAADGAASRPAPVTPDTILFPELAFKGYTEEDLVQQGLLPPSSPDMIFL